MHNELLNKIRAILFESTAPATDTIKLQEVKTIDGKVIMADKLEIGGICTIDGLPLPDGEYLLEDGSALEIKGGLIMEIKPPELATDLEVALETVNKLQKEIETLKFSITEKDTMIESIKVELSAIPAAGPIVVDAEKTQTLSPEMAKYQAYKKAIGKK